MPIPPDLEDLLRQSRERLKDVMPGGMGPGKIVTLALIVLLALTGLSGFYTIPDGQEGVVQRFGAVVRTENPGLQWRIPLIEKASIISTSQIFRLEVAGASATSNVYNDSGKVSQGYYTRTEDAAPNRMVTRDLNLVEVDFTVFWKISDSKDYLFNIRDPEGTLKLAAESVVREVIGRSTIEDVIPVASAETVAAVVEGAAAAAPAAAQQGSISRMAIEMRDRLQTLVNDYDAGITITDLQIVRAAAPGAVAAAFADVQQAQQDASSAINQAQVYANNVRAEATGESSRIKAEATAYKSQIVAVAKGDADRFTKVLDAYKMDERTTSTRLYLETMEYVLKGANKVMLSEDAAKSILPYLPLGTGARSNPLADLEPAATN